MKFLVELLPGEDGFIIVSCPALPGCHSQGETREDALENIREAILAWLEAEEIEAEAKPADRTELAIVDVTA